MATTYPIHPSTADVAMNEDRVVHTTQVTLKLLFGLVPIVAGVDKFTNFLAHWEDYLNPLALRVVHVSAHQFMIAVGVIEIVAGFLVAFKPKIGAPIVAIWLIGIIVNLLLLGSYFDIALRDFGLCLGALALSRLAMEFDRPVQVRD